MTCVCPECGAKVAQNDTRDGGWVIRTNLIKGSRDGLRVRAKCRGCGALVALPLVEQQRQLTVVRKKRLTPPP